MKGQQWCYVFDKDRQKLEKYFKRDCSKGPVYIRIYTKHNIGSFVQYFQMSGNEVGFNSIKIRSDIDELDIKNDFPFIKEIVVWPEL